MKSIESKGKLLGEVGIILGLQFIMLIFRLVEPIHWPSIFPGKYTSFLNEFVYLGIEFILIIVIIAHFIFEISFEELGLHKIKENIGTLILNLVYLGMSIGVAYFMSLFSKNVEIHWLELVCQVITNFVAIAFLKELIFRGFLFRSLYHLTNGKGILTSLMTAVVFAMTYIPSILIRLNEFSSSALLESLMIPFAMGLYLSLIYYYTSNLWTGVIFHGVFISLLGLEQDFAICSLEIIYAAILVIYLISKIVKYYRGEQDIEEEKKDEADIQGDFIEEKHPTACVVETENRQENIVEKIREEKKNEETPIVVSIPDFAESKDKACQPSKEIETYEAESIPKKMLNALDDLHEELKKQVKAPVEGVDFDRTLIMPALSDESDQLQRLIKMQEEETTPDLISMLNTDLEEEEEELRKPVHELHHAEPNYIAHLEKYLGEFEAVYKQVIPTNPPVDILYFRGEKIDALVTNGMRGLPMNVPPELKDYQNIELMMYVDKHFDLSNEGLAKSENAWLTKLLAEMAVYPSTTNGYLGWGHIVGNGDHLEPYDESIKYCGAMVYPSINEGDANFSRYRENSVNVFLYNVMPLYKEELKFIQEQSSEQFINLMASVGVNQVITPKRMNVISYMKYQ